MGYDLSRFITQVDDEFLCVICTMVLQNAVQSPQCEHSFCEQCIKEWLLINNCCPIDRDPLECDDLKPITRSLRNLLNKFEIKCDFESNGCNTVIKLENLQNHINQCIFNPNLEVTCEKGCGLKITKKQHDNYSCISHLANLVIHQQKQISKLNAKVAILMKEEKIWRLCDGIKVGEQNILECEDEIGKAQLIEPLKPEYSYFQIKILQLGIGNRIIIGLTRGEWSKYSKPYKGDIFYNGNAVKMVTIPEDFETIWDKGDIIWQKGDIIGCGVKFPPDFNGNENSVVKVYFTRNNELIGEKPIDVPDDGFFPTILMGSIGTKVTVDLFQNNF